MSDDLKPEQPPVSEEGEATQETAEGPKAEWEYRTEFRINTEMRAVVEATIKVAQAQVDVLRRRVEKLQYGS
jgi:hypothetical protein